MNNDYSEIEVRNLITVLLNDYKEKLKAEEITFLESIEKIQEIRRLEPVQYDLLRAMYDRMGEASY